ncbi:MAG: hypothetical protein AAF224_12680 [Pseudomonadota bacterium]
MALIKRIAVSMAGGFAFAAAASLGFGAGMVAFPAQAVAQEDDDESRQKRSQTLDPAVARVLQEVFTAIQEERYQEALGQINQLLAQRGDRMKAFDKATTYELRGSIKVNLDDYRGALSDFQSALNANGLSQSRNNQLRYFIAQIYFQLQQYQQAISGLNSWINSARAAGETVDPNAYYLLAAAYVQLQPPNYRAAVGPAERVVAARGSGPEPKKSDFDLLNLIYSELRESGKRGSLLERMVNLWPGERTYWTQLSGLYSQSGRDREAFSVLEVAYRAGLLSRESEIVTLVNYYSYFDNPYRGAKLLQREMEAGRVDRDLDNLVLLSQLYSQSREHKRAIPVLREASRLSSKGELSYRLGQVLLADEQYAASERALRTALNKGGMNARQTGDAWLLLGTARFSQAGPGDRETRKRAREAFQRATQYSTAGSQARNWVAYIKAIDDTEDQQDELECNQRIEAMRDDINRLRTQAQVCRLQNDGNCDAFETRLQEVQAEVNTMSTTRCGRKAPPTPVATDADDAASSDEDAETAAESADAADDDASE